MGEPSKQLVKQAQRLFEDVGDRAAFVDALTHPPAFAPTLLWVKPRPPEMDWEVLPPQPWQPEAVDRLKHTSAEIRPGRDALHDQGYYYCLDFSSVFAASAVQAAVGSQPMEIVIDLCAAPGGKSLFLWKILQPQQLVCNEVVRKRVKILISNLKRCGAMDAIVLNQDPSVLAAHCPDCAQLVLVDAPCSGQSLMAKGQNVPGCFHKVTLNRNANRQKRILANAAQLIGNGGFLLYTTCTYAQEENEQVGAWFLKQFPEFYPITVDCLHPYQSHLSSLPCYRLWPQSGLGAGAFAMLFQRMEGTTAVANPEFLERNRFKLYFNDFS